VQQTVEKQVDLLKGGARAAAADLEREGDEIVQRIDAVTESQRKQVQQLLDTTERLSGAFGGVAEAAVSRVGGIADTLSQRFGERIEAMQQAGGDAEATLQKAVRSKIEETHAQANELVGQLETRLAAISASRGEITAAEAELRDLIEQQSGSLTERSRAALDSLKQQITEELGNITSGAGDRDQATRIRRGARAPCRGAECGDHGKCPRGDRRHPCRARALDLALTDAEERHRALSEVMGRQRDAMMTGAEEAAQRFAATLKRHQEMTAANSTAIVADMMRKTGDVQRAIRDQGDSIITAVRAG